MTVNNLNKFVVRHFEKIRRFDRLSTSAVRANPRFHEDKSPIQTRPRESGDKTVTNPSLKAGVIRCVEAGRLTPALRLGLVGTRHTWALALMTQQPVCKRTRSSGRHEVVHVIYCQSLTV